MRKLKYHLIVFCLTLCTIQFGFSQEKSVFDSIQLELPVSLYHSVLEASPDPFSPYKINDDFKKNQIAIIYLNRSLTNENYITVPIQNFRSISRTHLNQTYQKLYFEKRLKETLLKIPDLSGINFKKLGTEFTTGH